MNVVSVIDAIDATRTADPSRRAGAEAMLAALYGEIIEPLREWIFNLECALDQADHHARELADTFPGVQADTSTGPSSAAACANAHLDLISALTFVVAELALANSTRTGTYPAAT